MFKKVFLSAIFILFISGCSSNGPIARSRAFPEPPENGLSKCANLQLVPNDAKTQDLTNTVSNNYENYHECNIKNNAWIEWYKKHKENYNNKKQY